MLDVPPPTALCPWRLLQRLSHALAPIANITTGVLLANDKFERASLPLVSAILLSLLIGYIDVMLRRD
jgi:hypothetical protein